jgi:dTDP-4-dehydrorhamnose reductase
MSAKSILILGSTGQLGKALQKIKRPGHHRYYFAGRAEIDLSLEDWEEKVKALSFDVLINCAAYTQVDKAESEGELCQHINHWSVGKLSQICAEKKAILLHISSDYVYHNEINRPLLETDPTLPQGAYALSKWQGEQAIALHPSKACILRTSWVFSSEGNNFVKTMLSLAETLPTLRIVDDQIGTPTSALDLARVLLCLLNNPVFLEESMEEGKPLVLNFSNEGVASWYDFALAIFEECSLPVACVPIPSYQYPTPAPRPLYSVLNKAKIKTLIDFPIPHWREALREVLAEMEMTELNQ